MDSSTRQCLEKVAEKIRDLWNQGFLPKSEKVRALQRTLDGAIVAVDTVSDDLDAIIFINANIFLRIKELQRIVALRDSPLFGKSVLHPPEVDKDAQDCLSAIKTKLHKLEQFFTSQCRRARDCQTQLHTLQQIPSDLSQILEHLWKEDADEPESGELIDIHCFLETILREINTVLDRAGPPPFAPGGEMVAINPSPVNRIAEGANS